MSIKKNLIILLQSFSLSNANLSTLYEEKLQNTIIILNKSDSEILSPLALKDLKLKIEKAKPNSEKKIIHKGIKDELKSKVYFHQAFSKDSDDDLDKWSESLSHSILDFYQLNKEKETTTLAAKSIIWDYLTTRTFEYKKNDETRSTHPPKTDKNELILKRLVRNNIEWSKYWESFIPFQMLLRKESIFGLYGFIKYFEIMLDIDLTGFIMEHQIMLPTFDTIPKIEALKNKMIEIQKEARSIT